MDDKCFSFLQFWDFQSGHYTRLSPITIVFLNRWGKYPKYEVGDDQ
jgi:hypothetical protein